MIECLTPVELERYHAGELSAVDCAHIAEHLSECKSCSEQDRELVQDNERLLPHVRAMAAAPEPPTLDSDGSSPKAAPEAAPPTIPGYRILRELHRGGQGIVFEALQESTRRKVAIKILLAGQFASHSAQKRFDREVELVARLKHQHIIAIFDSGALPDGMQYYVMDYIRGERLDRFVQGRHLDVEHTLKLFAHVCDAVQYAHQRGVIHRDLKPSNVLVDHTGAPKVLDFGLAKGLAGPRDTLVSNSAQVLGTIPYMSPEQARGSGDNIDTRSDIYALGVMLYEVLTGTYPYPVDGQMADALRHIAETPPTPPTRQWTKGSGVAVPSGRRLRPGKCPIDNEVQTIVLKALAKEPGRRYQSAGDLARDLRHYLNGEPIEAKRDSSWYVLRKSATRHRGKIAITAGFFVLASAFGLYAQHQLNERRIDEHIDMGFRHMTDKWYSEAIKHFDAVLAVAPDHYRALAYKAYSLKKEHFDHSYDYRNTEMLNEALRYSHLAVGRKPDAHGQFNLQSTLYYSLGDLDAAEKAARRCLEIKPDYHYAYSNLAKVLTLKGALAEALATATAGLDHCPERKGQDDDGIYRTIGILQMHAGKPATLLTLQTAATIDVRDSRNAVLIARTYLQPAFRNVDLALDFAKKALADRDIRDGRYNRILALALLANEDPAATTMNEVILQAEAATIGGDLEAYGHLLRAVAFARLGRTEEAEAALVQAEAQWPENLQDPGDVYFQAEKGLLWYDSHEELMSLADAARRLLEDGTGRD